ncbi:MAG: glycosyltransferase [Bacteroidales bacterium]|nr:glycosyltransferase [Bacteroidales bacterium]MDT8374379.1 glycosyltransferase [Bacteroidales bacterium]
MWWLTIPVIIYSAGICFLWLILRRHSGGDAPGDDGLTGVTGEVATPGGRGNVSLLLEKRTGVTGEVAIPGEEEEVSLLSESRTGVTLAVASPGEEERPTPLPETDIRVTVVVAVRNEERNVTTLLERLVQQDYPSGLLELIIVNDNSTDRTPVAVSEFMEAHRDSTGISMRLLFNPFPGKKKAIRLGVSRSSGDLILTTDADCTVGPGWISAHVSEYRGGVKGSPGTQIFSGQLQGSATAGSQTSSLRGDGFGKAGETASSVSGDGSGVTAGPLISVRGDGTGMAGLQDPSSGEEIPSMVLAPVVQRPGRGFWSRFGVFEFSALQAITEATARAGHPVMCNAANMSYARQVYLRHAGELRDNLPSGDDIFLLHAVRRGGGTVGFAGSSAAAVETAAAVTAAALLRQRARWASKAWYYHDPSTLILAAATAACNAAVIAAAVGAAISPQYLPLPGVLYAIRTVPDYLIITRNIKKSGEKIAPVPFVLSELLYPFWFMTVAAISLFPQSRRFGTR